MKILVVDDIKQNRYLLQKLLEGHGYTVETASNGVEAIEKARVSPPNMVVTDTLMHKMDGFQLCRELKKDEELKSIPILFYSATYTDKESRKLALDIGAVEYIIKPTEPDKFIKIVKEILDKYEKDELKPAEKPLEEKVYMKLYNERLIQKLEKKMLDLEMEITERKRAEDELRKVNRALKAISKCNQALIRAKEESELLHDMCLIIVEVGGYRLAWVGFAEQDEAKTVRPVAQVGFEEGYLDIVNITWADTEKGRGPTGKAIRTGKPCINRNLLTNPDYAPWRAEATKRGYASSITLPLIGNGQTFGALNIYAVEPDAFDVDEMNLLVQLADDLAYGIMALRTRAERKQAEEALKESQRYTRGIIEANLDALVTISAEGKITDVNQATELITGMSRKEIIGTDFSSYFTDPDAARKGYQQVYRDNYLQDYPLEIKHRDGKVTPVLYNASVYKDAQGRIAGFFVAARDITKLKQAEEERRKLQAQLQQVQKMEAIGTLAGGIAHDFNNILSLIIGYTELSMRDFPEGSRVQDNMNKLLEAGERARDLVKQILTFSRHAEYEQKPLQIHLIIKEALKLLRPSLPTTIEIRQNIASTGMVMADPTQMHQVIMNLSTNAYHAMQEKGGVLEVSLADVELDSDFTARHLDTHTGPYIRLTVSDTGHGIKKKDIDRIFEPYYTTRDKTGGTGMGLAVVHGIVKSYEGAITVYSEPGKGTTFNVFLPRIESAEAEAEIEEMGPIPTGNEQILLVDDEPAIVDIGKGMLENLGYTVETRTSPIEALEAFKAKPDKFDLVITDMTMPKMTGDELAKKLMGIRPDIPIILCTGFSERINEEKAKAMGIRKLVMKPIVQREMANAVRKALDQPSTF